MQHEFVIVYGYLLRTKLGFQNDFLLGSPIGRYLNQSETIWNPNQQIST